MFTNLSIDINKKSNLCFSYTDRINSYLHIHCLDDDLTDGLRYDNKQLLKNICIYDKSKHKILTAKDCDKIIYTPYCTDLYYENVKLKISLLLNTKTELPVLSVAFINSENVKNLYPAILIGKDVSNPYFYDELGNQINSVESAETIQDLFFIEDTNVNKFYCAFKKNERLK
mgnify:FL=1